MRVLGTRKWLKGWISKTSKFARVAHFLVTAQLRREIASFQVYRERRQTTTNNDEFHSLSLNLNIFFRNSTLGEFGCICQSEWVRIIKVKSQRTWSHILSDVLAAVAVCKAWSSKVKQAQNKHKSKHTTNKSIKWGENWTLDLAGLNVVFQPPKVSEGKTLRLCFEFYLNVMLRLHCIFQLLLYKYRRRGTLERSVFPPFSTPVFKTLTLTA